MFMKPEVKTKTSNGTTKRVEPKCNWNLAKLPVKPLFSRTQITKKLQACIQHKTSNQTTKKWNPEVFENLQNLQLNHSSVEYKC